LSYYDQTVLRRRIAAVSVQNHLRRDGVARAVIGWIRESFRDFSHG
jgi:hypothetical protein